MRGKQWNCLTLQLLVNNHRLVWSYGNCADQCHNWNMIILLSFKQKRFQGFFWIIFLFQTVWVLHLLLIPINLLSLPSDSFFNAIWPRIMKEKTFPFELRTLLVNDPLFISMFISWRLLYSMPTDLIYCYLLGENIIWWKKPKAADWPSGEVQLDFLIWLDISNLIRHL